MPMAVVDNGVMDGLGFVVAGAWDGSDWLVVFDVGGPVVVVIGPPGVLVATDGIGDGITSSRDGTVVDETREGKVSGRVGSVGSAFVAVVLRVAVLLWPVFVVAAGALGMFVLGLGEELGMAPGEENRPGVVDAEDDGTDKDGRATARGWWWGQQECRCEDGPPVLGGAVTGAEDEANGTDGRTLKLVGTFDPEGGDLVIVVGRTVSGEEINGFGAIVKPVVVVDDRGGTGDGKALAPKVPCAEEERTVNEVPDGAVVVTEDADEASDEAVVDVNEGLARKQSWVCTGSCRTMETAPITKLRISDHTPQKDCRFRIVDTPGNGLLLLLQEVKVLVRKSMVFGAVFIKQRRGACRFCTVPQYVGSLNSRSAKNLAPK
jgi:hypothetical protein